MLAAPVLSCVAGWCPLERARVWLRSTPSGPAGGGAASSGDGGGVDCFGRGETPVGGSQGAGSVDVIGLDWAEFVCGPGSWAWGERAETNAQFDCNQRTRVTLLKSSFLASPPQHFLFLEHL